MDLRDFAHDSATAELIGSKNFKQALKNIDKRLKKSTNDLRATALKANLLLLSGDPSGSHALCSTFTTKSPVVTDQHVLDLVYHNLCELRLVEFEVEERQLDSLWQNAINAQQNPDKKRSLAMRWANQSIRKGQWQQTVKAAMIVQKSLPSGSPQARVFWFWQIVARYMAGKTATTEQLRTVQLGLALKTLEKAITDIPADPASLEQSGLWISSVTELKLLTNTFSREGKHQELIQAIDKVSETIKNDYAFSIDRSRALRKLDNALDRWNNAKATLNGAEEHQRQWLLDDSRPWSDLVEVSVSPFASEIDTDVFTIAQDMAKHQASSNAFSRASRQALLNLRWHGLGTNSEATESSNGQSELSSRVRICLEHFSDYADRHFALNDIQDKIRTFNKDDSLLFSQKAAKTAKEKSPEADSPTAAQIKWTIAETNALRVDYQFLKRDPGDSRQNQNSESETALYRFISSCFRLYDVSSKSTAELASTDFGLGDEVCLLACEAIYLLHELFEVASATFYRICLLAELLAVSEFNFVARTQLIGQLVQLEFYRSAFSIYSELSVKDILHESMAPLIFARISTANPFASDGFDCRGLLERPLGFFEEGISKISSYQQVALESQNYAQVLEMEDLMQKLKDSPTKWLLALERRRTARLRNTPYDHLDLSLDVLKVPLQMNLDHLSPESQKYPTFHFGDVDNFVLYIRYLAHLDLVHEILSNFPANPERSRQILQSFQDRSFGPPLTTFDIDASSEQDVAAAYGKLISLLSSLTSTSPDPEKIILHLDELIALSEKLWNDARISFWTSQLSKNSFSVTSFTRECYASFELLQNLFKTSDIIKTYSQQTQNAGIKAKRQEVQKKATELASIMTSKVKALVDLAFTITSHVPGKLSQELKDASLQTDDISKAVRGIVTQERVTQVMAWYLKDSRMALEGLLNLKLRATKP